MFVFRRHVKATFTNGGSLGPTSPLEWEGPEEWSVDISDARVEVVLEEGM